MKEPLEIVKKNNHIIGIDEDTLISQPQPLSSSYGYVATDPEEGIHLRDYWRAVRKRLWLICGIVALVSAVTTIRVARIPDIYQAEVRVQVDLESSNAGLVTNKEGYMVAGGQDPTYFNTQLQILSGPGLLRRVAKTLDLEHNQSFSNPSTAHSRSTWQSLKRMFGYGGGKSSEDKGEKPDELLLTTAVAPETSREDLAEAKRLAPLVDALQGGLKVTPVKENRTSSSDETRLIDISFTHGDPQVATKVVNAIAEAFALSNLEQKTQMNTSAGDFLQKRIAELQTQIRNGEERLINYSKNHQILSLDTSQNTVVERLVVLNKQLLEAENERTMAEAAYRAGSVKGAASAMAENSSKESADLEGKLAELRQRRAQLLVEVTEEWPEVKEVNQQIAALEKQVGETRSRATSVLTTNLETRYRQALAREQAVRAAFLQQRGETLTQNEAAVNYRIIQQEIDTNKKLLDNLLQRSKENDVVMAGTPNNIHVVDYALVPDSPVGPKRMNSVMLGFILSLAFGVGFSLFLDYMDDSIRTVDDVEKNVLSARPSGDPFDWGHKWASPITRGEQVSEAK